MKKYSCILPLLLITSLLYAQPVKKQKPADKPPTSKEMKELMQAAQKAVDDVDPADKKLMDSLGVKMPSFNNVPIAGDKALSEAYEEDGKLVPTRKTTLINALPAKIFTKDELLAYIKKTNTSILTVIRPAAKQMADKLIDQFKNDPYYGYMIAAAANGMWMMHYKEAATYLMGKAAEALPNADNLNNFAAYLTMGGAAHIAIPILDKLNSIHKRNSTIFNNLGQAWLQLGDGARGEKYLDSAIMIYAHHPQANYTKCLLLESRGKNAEAIAALKRSLAHSVTKNKLTTLKQLEGSNFKPRRFYAPRIYYSTTFDLHQYVDLIPTNYAFKLGGDVEKEWESFRDIITDQQEKITAQMELVQKQAVEQEKAFQAKMIANHGVIYSPYHEKAVLLLNQYNQQAERTDQHDAEEWAGQLNEKVELKTTFEADYKKEQDKFDEAIKNGADQQMDCDGLVPIINAFLEKTNKINQQYNAALVKKLLVKYYNLYYYLPSTANTDATAQAYVLSLRGGFLEELKNLYHESDLGYPCSNEGKVEEKYSKPKPLKDYDDVNCSIHNSINSPGLGVIDMRCNTMSLHLNPILVPFEASLKLNYDGFVEEASVGVTVKAIDIKAGAEFDAKGNFVKGQGSIGTEVKGIGIDVNGEFDSKGFTKGSIELGLDHEMSLLPKSMEEEAPVDIAMKNKLGVSMEFSKGDDGIIADFAVKDKTDIEFASKIEVDDEVETSPGMISTSGKVTDPEAVSLGLPSAPSVSVSADSRWSVNSGYSVNGESSFSKLK